ncbi:MAG TPA: site-2 protease family protein [Vicinamibacterales bacterium]|jgi:regulator of sigma E protease
MSYITVVFVVGLLIAIHEFGHLLAAKLCGIPIKRFSIGFGPKVFEFTHGDTSYWLSWIPVGGYVWPAIEPDDFRELPVHKRITFALGGPLANVIAAFVSLLILGFAQLDLPASDATSFAITRLLAGLQQQIAGLSALLHIGQLSGIVGIVAVGGAHFGSTFAGVLTFSALINLSLAVMNLLPLPPLDGGRILFCVLEKIYRPLGTIEVPVTVAGWSIVVALMVYLTVQDVGRILA